MKVLDVIVAVLMIIGGLNWGLVGFFNYDLILTVFGAVVHRVLFGVVGLAGIYTIVRWIGWKYFEGLYCSHYVAHKAV
jgi:uncharacterized membrane protein YuzA (DUF378 family)